MSLQDLRPLIPAFVFRRDVARLGPLPGGHDTFPRDYIAQSKGLILKIQKTVEVLLVQFVSGACDAEY